MTDDSSVANVDLGVWLLLPREGVLHPVFVVPIWEVLASVSTTRLLAIGSRFCSLYCAGKKIAELKSFDKVGIPDHAAILGADVIEHLVNIVHPDNGQ